MTINPEIKTERDVIVITDSSVLINFLAVDRMDLLATHPNQFLITDHVASEITYAYSERYDRFQDALRLGIIAQITVNDPSEVDVFIKLTSKHRLGDGECSAIAVAKHRGYTLAIDDSKAIKMARSIDKTLSIITTKDLVVDCIMQGTLDIETADALKEDWAQNHRFTINISSFRELLPDEIFGHS